MDPQIQSLRFWHDLIAIYALLLGAEGPVLLWVGTFLQRPRHERALAFVPVLAFCWGAWSAKLINDQQVNATSALVWGRAHYPMFPVSVDATAAVASAARTGWVFGAVATLLLIGGWALVLQWAHGKGLPAWPRPHRIFGAPTGSPMRLSVPSVGRQAAPVANASAADDEGEDEGLEITIERLDD